MIKIIIFILLSFISVNKVFSDQNSPKLEGLFEDLYIMLMILSCKTKLLVKSGKNGWK